MKEKNRGTKTIGFKIICAIVACSAAISVVVGGICITTSRGLIEAEARDKLLLTVESNANQLDKTIMEVESSVNGLATAVNAMFSVEDMQSDPSYLGAHLVEFKDITRNFGEMAEGAMGSYVYLNPELTGGVYGAWKTEMISYVVPFYSGNTLVGVADSKQG